MGKRKSVELTVEQREKLLQDGGAIPVQVSRAADQNPTKVYFLPAHADMSPNSPIGRATQGLAGHDSRQFSVQAVFNAVNLEFPHLVTLAGGENGWWSVKGC